MWFTLEDASEKLGVSIDTVHEVLGISMIQILESQVDELRNELEQLQNTLQQKETMLLYLREQPFELWTDRRT